MQIERCVRVNVVITGAAGFAASHLIRLLLKNKDAKIFAWVKDTDEAQKMRAYSVQVCVVDITNQQQVWNALEQIRPDQVYHLAAQASVGASWKMPALTMEVNAVGTLHLLEGLRLYAPQARVLLVGSAEQYGRIEPEDLPVAEEHPLQGNNPYSVSKMTQELLAHMYAQHFGMQLMLVRAFNHIGPGQGTQFVIPDWCSQVVSMERGERRPVLFVGNIHVRRDFTDVRDIVRAYKMLMEKGLPGETYNVGSGISYSLEDVLQTILHTSCLDNIRYEVDEKKLRPADIPELRGDISRLRKLTGWKPEYILQQSILDIMEEMRKR